MLMVTVQLFASCAEAFGAPTLEIPLEHDSTVADLVLRMRSLPAGSALSASARVAVNRKFAPPSQIVCSSDEIAVIPPVAGG